MKLISTQPDFELAETYYNSIHRRIAQDDRVDETQSFVWSEFHEPPVTPAEPIFRTYPMHRDMVATITQILRDLDFDLPWQDLDRDVRNILRSLAEARPEIRRPAGLDVEILEVDLLSQQRRLPGRFAAVCGQLPGRWCCRFSSTTTASSTSTR